MSAVHDPSRLVADVWQRAAALVRTLEDAKDGSWNDAVDQAARMLDREAENIRVMGRMAHLLNVGNTEGT